MTDSGRFVLAIVLMIAVMVLTNLIFAPTRPDPEAVGPVVPPEEVREQIPEEQRPELIPEAPPAEPPPPVAAVGADTVFIESPLYRFGISSAGGALVHAELLRFESQAEAGGAVQLVDTLSHALVATRINIGNRPSPLDFDFEEGTPRRIVLAEGDAPVTLRMAQDDPAIGGRVELHYTFHPGEYTIRASARTPGLERYGPQLLIDLGPTLAIHEANPAEDIRALAFVTHHPQAGINSTRLGAVRTERIEGGPLHWVALKNKYFVAAVLQAGPGTTPFGGVIARPGDREHTAGLTATLQPAQDGSYEWRLYAGPQEHQRLTDLGFAFQDVNPFGWRLFRPILRPLGHGITWLLVAMHNALDVGYGVVLVLFGVLIRVVLWPLNAKAMRSQLKSMELQPRMKEIQTKYKDKPEMMQKEMLKLYKEEGFNPFGGCLPLMIPLPVLITLFFVFQSTIEFRGESFLWLPDLSRADPLYIMPVLMGLSMFVLQFISMRSSPMINPQMKFMMYIMPGMMVVFFLNFASGLNLYYTAMNLASLPQQILITRERKRHLAAKGLLAPKT